MKSKWYDMSRIDALHKVMVVQFIEMCYFILLHAFNPQVISLWRKRDDAIRRTRRLERRGVLNSEEACRLITAIYRVSYQDEQCLQFNFI